MVRAAMRIRMFLRIRSVARRCPPVAVIGALLLLSCAQPVRALGPANRVFGVKAIGGLAVGTSYLETIRYFNPSEPQWRFDRGGCTLSYRTLDLSLWYIGNPLDKGSPKTCVHFEEAIVTAAGWHTRNGLYIGDSVRKLRRLFPRVYDTRHAGPKTAPAGSIEWDITITCCGGGERPALSAMVRRSRVVALRVAMVGH
jgi:hypothetical protein